MATADVIATRIKESHPDTLDGVRECADRVAKDLGKQAVTGRNRIGPALKSALTETGVLAALPQVLQTGAAVIGEPLVAEPVAAPPYVVVTSRGPVLRGTCPGHRLVITLRVYNVHRNGKPEYRRIDGLDVEIEIRDRVDSA